MNQLKIYKKFFKISIIPSGSTMIQNYVLIDPFTLSANTYVAGTGATESNTLVESEITISKNDVGIYFADLNSNLYASDITYDLVWFINYTSSAPVKKLSTRFRVNSRVISNQIEIEYINSPLEIEIINGINEIEIN